MLLPWSKSADWNASLDPTVEKVDQALREIAWCRAKLGLGRVSSQMFYVAPSHPLVDFRAQKASLASQLIAHDCSHRRWRAGSRKRKHLMVMRTENKYGGARAPSGSLLGHGMVGE